MARKKGKDAVQIEFREVGTTGVFMARTEASLEDSMDLLQQNGLRALTYQEALVKMDQSPALKGRLKGRWLYLDGKGVTLSGFCSFDEEGELTKGKARVDDPMGPQEDMERTVYVLKGSRPLSLLVLTDDFTRYSGFRFDLVANYGPSVVAGAVVGVRADQAIS